MYLLQQKKSRMVFLKDGSAATGGYAPYASRFTNGAYTVSYTHLARLYVAGRCDNGLIAFDDRCRFWTYVNQCADIPLCLAHRPFLK